MSAAAALSNAVYVWTFPGAPLEIHVDVDVLDRLAAEAAAGPPAEGVLLGQCVARGVRICDYVRIEHGSLAEWLARPDAIAAWNQRTCAVIGAFRIQRGEAPALSEADVRLMRQFLPDPNVFLSIAANHAGATPAAGFFFWEGDRLESGVCRMVFPLRARRPAPPVAAAESPAPAPPPVRRAWRFLALAAMLVAAALAGSLWLQPRPPAARTLEPQAEAASYAGRAQTAAGLQVEARSTDLLIRWDRASALVANARVALLTIVDGASRREIPLLSGQLLAGTVTYTPLSSSIEVKLELFAPDGTRTSEEALAVWMRGGDVETRPVQSTPEPATAPAVLKPFVAPSPAGRAPAPRLPEPPPALVASGTAAAALPVQLPRPEIAAPVAPPAASPAAEEPAPAAAPPVEQAVVPPRPIRRVTPQVPQSFRAMLKTDTEVRLRVHVDAKGNVSRVEPAGPSGSSSSVVLAPAMMAAKAWRFEPARRAGRAVPSEFLVVFQFPAQR